MDKIIVNAPNKAAAAAIMGIQSTAGAIPVLNEKGEVSMQKVKVHRYVSGKRPEYAPESSSDEESEEEFQVGRAPGSPTPPSPTPEMIREHEKLDPRLRRLQLLKADDDIEDRKERHRHIHEPEVIEEDEEEEETEEKLEEVTEEQKVEVKKEPKEPDGKHYNFDLRSDDDEPAEDLDEDEIERRRMALREKALMRKEEELLGVEDEGKGSMDEESEEESSEYEEYTDSEEDTGPRLKPVFVRKKDRVTIQEKEKEALKQKQIELEMKKFAEERRKYTLKMVEEDARKEIEKLNATSGNADDVNTDDDNDEAEYESWKIRELKRIKRDKEEREVFERERLEVERLRNMTEEERRLELRNNPKFVTNKAIKGKYKFLQKYFHRGAFYLDEDDQVFKRDFSAATLEDHFDKTVLPKVMQVKNFGRSGRTKYTHLVDQDTTHFDSPWVSESSMNLKFSSSQAGGMKQVFNRPSTKKRSS